MIAIVLYAAGAVGLDELARYVAHHRTGLLTGIVSAAAWLAHLGRRHHRARRRGQRRVGMPHLAPVGQRKPELVAEVRAAAAQAKKAAARKAAAAT